MTQELNTILNCTLIAIFMLIFYQDIRFRGIHWLVFPLLFINVVMLNFSAISLQEIGWNLLILALLLLSLTLYLGIKQRTFVNITKGYFSWGDILFLLAVLPLFETRVFLLYFVTGTCLSLILHGIYSLIKEQKTLPYAGYMSLSAIAYLFLINPIQQMIHLLYNA